jgi:hypothetical protein
MKLRIVLTCSILPFGRRDGRCGRWALPEGLRQGSML